VSRCIILLNWHTPHVTFIERGVEPLPIANEDGDYEEEYKGNKTTQHLDYSQDFSQTLHDSPGNNSRNGSEDDDQVGLQTSV